MTYASGTPTEQISEWLSKFDAALERADLAALVEMFVEESYWRDLVSFTWNIKTLEGQESIQAMLQATLPEIKPHSWRITGESTSEYGVTAGWFTFETATSKGQGHIRLRAGKCWTLLTTMTELKGFGRKKGRRASRGRSTVCLRIVSRGWSGRLRKRPSWVMRHSPIA